MGPLRYRTRTIVFRTLFVLYFFVATGLLLFANGYRIKFTPFTISRTGNILATFTPKKATLTIDDVVVNSGSPARIRALFPGIHTISISAPDYIPYVRSVRIEPQVTSFVSEIFLLRDTDPRMVFESTTTPSIEPDLPITTVADRSIAIETTTSTGTRIVINDTPVTRDLGIGTWAIVGGDENVFALARKDTNTLQFRAWNSPESSITTLPGTAVVPHEFNNNPSLLVYGTFELWSFNTDRHTAELVYRFSKPVKQVISVPNTTIVVVQLADELVAFHLGDHHYIPTKISGDSTEPIVSTRLLQVGNTIEFTRQTGELYTTYVRELY